LHVSFIRPGRPEISSRKYKKFIDTTNGKNGLFPGAPYSKVALSPLIKLSFSALDSSASGWAKKYCGDGILFSCLSPKPSKAVSGIPSLGIRYRI